MASASALNATFDVPGSETFGQENVPLSNRFPITHIPLPSKYRIFRRVCRRLPKTKSAPLRTSSVSVAYTTRGQLGV